jgi:hypothetical protein
MRLALMVVMTNIPRMNSFRDLPVWQVSMDLADLLRLAEPVGKMLHGPAESLEERP